MKKFLNLLVILALIPLIQLNATQPAATTHIPQPVPQQTSQVVQKKNENPRIFSGSANPKLASKISEIFGQTPGDINVKRFNDGEISIQYNENLRGKNIYLFQPTCTTNESDVDKHIMELFFMTKAARRASADTITAIIPYFGYARQDRKTSARVTISASDVASFLEFAGINRVVAIDLHCGQIQGFFRDIPVDNLPASVVFAPYIATLNLKNPVIVSPDAGGAERARKLQTLLTNYGVNAGYAMIVKERAGAGIIEKMDLLGDVTGKDAIIIDDICDTGGTLIKAGEELLKRGAKSVYVCFTHPVFSNDAITKLCKSCFTKVITTDTIPLRNPAPDNLVVLSVAPMLAEVIKRIQNDDSVSEYLNNPTRVSTCVTPVKVDEKTKEKAMTKEGTKTGFLHNILKKVLS
jgi:ribose-phosphate pyrophosphokinase